MAEFDWLFVVDKNCRHGAAMRGNNVVEGFHRLDQQDFVTGIDRRTDFHIGLGFGRGAAIGGADHWRRHAAGDFLGLGLCMVVGGCHHGSSHRSRCGHRDSDWCRMGDLAGNTDAQITLFHFDFAQMRLGQHFGELTHQLGVDG